MRSLRCVFKPAQLVWFTGFSADVVPVGAADKTLMSYVSAPLYSTSFGSRVLGHSPLQHFLREEVDSTRSPLDGDGHPPALCSSSFTLCDQVTEYARRSCLVGLPLDSARPLTLISWCWPLSAVHSSCGALIVLIERWLS